MRGVKLMLLGVVAGLGLLAGCSSEPAAADDERLCAYQGDVEAPCPEGERFAKAMVELGFPGNAGVYMPTVAADTCSRKAAGLPLVLDSDLQRAYRHAEIVAHCP